jgi:hypothetical protein
VTDGDSGSLPPSPEPNRPDATPTPASPGAPEPLDALFGESRFARYQDGIAAAPARRPAPKGTRVAPRPPGVTRSQKVMIGIAGAVVAALALVALFFLGTRLPTLLASAVATPTPTATRTPTPTPTSTAAPVGPAAAGVHGWNELRGGECIDPYTNPWAEKFTVVDCAVAHPAQMVFRGTFPPATVPIFPGAAALQAQISLSCAAPGVLDLAAAGQYSDAQVQAAYPVTQEEWTAGQHDYFCFISRAGGQPLTGSVAVPKAP